MEHRRIQRRSISPSGAYRAESFAASDLAAMHRTRQQGNGHFRKLMSSPKVGLDSTYGNYSSRVGDSFPLEFEQSFKKSSVTSIGKEMSKETESRTPSPSVIAKLMGLDEFPPPQVGFKQQKDKERCFRYSSSAGFQEGHMSHEDTSPQMSSGEYQEFKDVFEIMETSIDEKGKNQRVQKRVPISKHIETVNAQFHEFLPEPNSLLTKHLHNLMCSPPSSIPSHKTILKSSEDSKHESNEVYSKSQRKDGRCTYMRKDVISTLGNPTTGLFSQSFKEHGDSSLYNLPKSENVDEVDMWFNPTQIVLLKPSLDKGHNVARNAPLPRCHETCQFGYRRHREFWSSGRQELYAEGRGRQKLFTNAEVLVHKTKGSREIAREITKQIRNRISGTTRMDFSPKFDGRNRDESLSKLAHLNNYEAFRRTPVLSDDWNSSYNHPSYYSDESSVTREARKRLSERWRIIHSLQGVGPFNRGSSTLAEMLALSDRETSRKTVHPWRAKNVLDEKLAGDEALETEDYCFGKYNRDEAAGSINFPCSVSHPVSSPTFRSPKSSSRNQGGDDYNSYMLKDVINLGSDHSVNLKSNQKRSSLLRSIKFCSQNPQFLKSSGEENDIPIQKIHPNPEEWRNKNGASNIAEEKPILYEFAGKTVADTHLARNFLFSEVRDATILPLHNQNQVEHPKKTVLPAKGGRSYATVQNDAILEEKSYDHSQVDSLSSHSEEEESDSFLSSKEVEHPSPDSVLEPPPTEEKYNSGCFGSVGSGLQELRAQLELIKLESEVGHTEESEQDAGEESQTILQMEKIFSAFRDEEDRDFSYLLDMLVESGIRSVYQEWPFNTCNSLEYPVGPDVFVRLEKKYDSLETWSRSQRKLLFDLINSSLAEILVPLVNVQPWLGLKRKLIPKCSQDGLVEELWQMVVSQRRELSASNLENKGLDLSWFDLGDDVNNIAREIEGMLVEDILEELVFEFVLV